jgi:hypothetical protein
MGHDTGQRMDSDVKCTNTVVLAGQVLTLVKCLVRSMLARATYAIGGRQRLLKQLPAASWKRGNTAFILASGASINSLDTSHWDRISEGTKIGFNFWVKHDVVPDLYVFENLHSSLLSLLVSRRVDYSSVPIVLKHQLGLYQIFGRRRALSSSLASLKASGLNVYLSTDYPIRGRSVRELRQATRALFRLRVMSPRRDTLQWLPVRSASLVYLCALAARSGFKKIVLCGVDLAGPYFFDEHEGQLEANLTRNLVHPTNDPSTRSVTVSQALDVLNGEFLMPSGILLYVASPESPLADFLPVFEW